MASSYKQLAKSSTLYVVLGFLPLGINLFLAPVYTAYLPPEEYALIFLTGIIQSFVVVFISPGLDPAFSRFYFFYFKKPKLLHALLSTVLLFVLFSGVVIGVLLFLFGDFITASLIENDHFSYSQYGVYGFLTAWAMIIQGFFLAYYRNQEQALAFTLTSLTFFCFSVTGILLGVVYFEAMALGSVMGRALANCLVSFGLLILFWARNPMILRLSFLKKILNFGVPIAISILLMTIFGNIDRIMIDQFFEEEVLGLYGFAFLLASVMSVLIYSMFNALVPRIFKFMTEDLASHLEEIRNIWHIFFIVFMFLVLLGIAVLDPFLRLFIDEKYYSILPYTGILFIMYIIDAYRRMYQLPLLFYKKTRYYPYASLIELLFGIGINLLLIPKFGIWAVCLSVLLIKCVQVITLLVQLRIFNLHQESWLEMPKIHLLATMSVFFYLGLIGFNESLWNIPYLYLNLLPLLLYVILVFLLFRNRLFHLWKLGKQKLSERNLR